MLRRIDWSTEPENLMAAGDEDDEMDEDADEDLPPNACDLVR